MGNSESNNGITPFGAEETAETTATAAPSSMEAFSSYLNEGALFIIAALIVAAFLIFQFTRWFLNQPSAEQIPAEADIPRAQPVEVAEAAPEEEVSVRPRRPWNSPG